MAKDASFQMLIDMCNKVGWDKGLQSLEKMVYANENMQASLFSGDNNQSNNEVTVCVVEKDFETCSMHKVSRDGCLSCCYYKQTDC